MKNLNALVASAVIAITSTAALSQSSAVQWTTASGGNGHWYKLETVARNWLDQRNSAAAIGGHLATLNTPDESAWVTLQLPFSSQCFLGAFQDTSSPAFSEPAGGWRWVTDEDPTTIAWCQNEPNNLVSSSGPQNVTQVGQATDCVDDTHGLVSFVAWVEWSADCNNDGIVDYGQILSGQLIDTNSNGILDICEVDPCPGDISNNGVVDGVDLTVLLGLWGTDGTGGKFFADVTADGVVDGADLTVVLGGWGSCPN